MKNWQIGYSYPTQINQHINQHNNPYTTHPSNFYTPINYGVQRPYFKNGPINHGNPYGVNVYPNQNNTAASRISEVENVQNLFKELDELKVEARKYKEAEATRLAEIAQELQELREETRRFGEHMDAEEEDIVEQRTEQVVSPQSLPPAYVIELPFPQHGMSRFITPDCPSQRRLMKMKLRSQMRMRSST